jgi:uncharacterized protein (DUF1501 family)
MDRPLTRRQVLLGALGVGAVGAAGLALGNGPWDWLASATDPTRVASVRSATGTVVLVTLYGGNDGLNTVIPYANSAYLAGRATIGFKPEEVLALDAAHGLHPNLTGLKGLWDSKQLAIVRGVGYPNPNRSHFRSMDIWQSGIPDRPVATGWVGRWLDAQAPDPLRALALGSSVPLVMTGAKTAAAAVPTTGVKLPLGAAFADGFAALGGASGSPLVTYAAQRQRDVLAVQRALAPVLADAASEPIGVRTLEGGGTPTSGPVRNGRTSGLGQQLAIVAAALRADLPTRVFHVSLGGFDTHSGEKQRHANLMAELDAALAEFIPTIAKTPRGQSTAVVVYSEFGRRVQANGSDGTDHGTAAPVLVLGPRVKGGFYGEDPSLTDLDNGDLKYTTDFRAVFGTAMGHLLGADPKDFIGGPQADLGFLA